MSATPYGIIDTVKYAWQLTMGSLDEVWRLAKPIILPLVLLNVISSAIENDEAIAETFPWNLIAFICNLLFLAISALFAIGWHRLVILGPSKDNHVRLLDLTRSEIGFVLATLGFGACGLIVLVIAGVLVGLFAGGVLALAGWFFAAVFFLFCTAAFVRASLYLPGKAVDAGLTLRQAFALGEGLVWKIFASTFLAMLTFLIPALIVLVILIAVFVFIAGLFNSSLAVYILMFIVSFPAVLIGMVGAAMFVTVLSRYFIWAIQNRQVA